MVAIIHHYCNFNSDDRKTARRILFTIWKSERCKDSYRPCNCCL